MKFPLGALLNGKYILPKNAEKNIKYTCPECNKIAILRKGNIRIPHFAHKVDNNSGCNYYNHPGESEIHKLAKYILADALEKRILKEIFWMCRKCETMSDGPGFSVDIEYKDGDSVKVEYRGDGYVADVAVLNGGKVRYIFEVLNTHRTTSNCRPEPWFEILADDIVNSDRYCKEPELFECQRKHYCIPCTDLVNNEPWLENIPHLPYKVGSNDNWNQKVKCFNCEQIRYSPMFHRGPRALCKECFGYDFDKIKNELKDLKKTNTDKKREMFPDQYLPRFAFIGPIE